VVWGWVRWDGRAAEGQWWGEWDGKWASGTWFWGVGRVVETPTGLSIIPVKGDRVLHGLGQAL